MFIESRLAFFSMKSYKKLKQSLSKM